MGAVPVVANSSGLLQLFRSAPALVLDDWDRVDEGRFLRHKVRTRSKKMVLAQYWFDLIDSLRAPFRKRKSGESDLDSDKP